MNDITIEINSGLIIEADIQSGGEIVVDIIGRGPQGNPGTPGKDADVQALTNIEIQALLGI